ncbi:serine/threonine-protein kinase [Urbifossiella limnaea]|uniref:Serine/threonine-protein kinase PknB n=1 Tax=Urbifossiella limnaea TaxID=2528023 RepID=A0A517XL00_9BACT|nr:serine/threonine-protein kinase [Urbifossiella limnaea]QDU18185.1 Serine/threonine-protein kinase PknB [Urbifossiella limnaea]
MPTAPAPPPAVTDRQAFLAALCRSGILAPARLAKATAAVPDDATAAAAAAALVAAGFLTRFQAGRLLAGRTDGFVIDPYVIQEEVGRGPGGRVFKALHGSMHRTVAIKVLAAGRTRTPDAKEAFRREARAAAGLNHPNIITAFDASERGERAYVATEYVDGPDLARLVKARGPLPAAEACEIVRQAAVALEYAREQGMTHSGIKPTNLLVARASKTLPGCVVKVADFGISRLAPADAAVDTDTQLPAAGAADYAAPEAAGDHRSDLYSLGCVFYFLLTGRPPFPGGSAESKASRHRGEFPAPVEAQRPDVPPGVAEVVRRLLAKDPNARYPSAAALAARLDALAGGAGDEDGGYVAFDVPAGQASSSYQPGYLTGMNPPPAPTTGRHAPVGETLSDASPWAALTDEVRPPRRRGGVSAVTLLAVVLSVAGAVALGASLVLKAVAR